MLLVGQSCLSDGVTHLCSDAKVTLLSFKVESEYTFVDFIRGGYVVVDHLSPGIKCFLLKDLDTVSS